MFEVKWPIRRFVGECRDDALAFPEGTHLFGAADARSPGGKAQHRHDGVGFIDGAFNSGRPVPATRDLRSVKPGLMAGGRKGRRQALGQRSPVSASVREEYLRDGDVLSETE